MLVRILNISLVAVALLAYEAVAQQLTVSAISLNFGSHVSGGFSSAQNLTLSNSGNVDVVVSSISASGGFSQSNNCTTLHSGQSCTVSVTHISALLGPGSGVVTIADNTDLSPHIVNVMGSVVAPVRLMPASLNFGSIAVGTASPAKSIDLVNQGPGFGIRAIRMSGDYSQTNNCPATLASGQSCTIRVSFHPGANGSRAGVLSVTSMDPGQTIPLSGFTAALTGSGFGGTGSPQVSVQPASANFGNKSEFDIFKPAKTITLTNNSTSSLTVQSVSILSPINSGVLFYSIGSSSCAGMLAPGAQCTIKIVHNPSDSGFAPQGAAGSLMIVDSDPTSPQVAPLSTNLLPEVRFMPPSLSFGSVPVGTSSAPLVATVTNNMDRSGISLLRLVVRGDFSPVNAGTTPCGSSPSFNVGTSCTLGVVFTPHATGPVSGAVTFTLYPECDVETTLNHVPCPDAQVVNLSGSGQ